ncbi:NADPH oxidase organizer 1a [Melanotaenia boesemani]|uniref:NADPH oxidase organizer 1a n=1 Tax=Melanotaenia boesemani TaxID=1250792 RepID=UPI001C041216|nr:NADPH oxidase organizer 1a [Melanotaenia boesemani]
MELERYPVSVRLIGLLHKEKSKTYITSVLWSDQNEIVVYRSLKDFKIMHKQIKKEFPSGSKVKKSNRILPKFKASKMYLKSQKKGPTNSLACLKYLQRYCNELLSCDPQVSQSAHLIQFFNPKNQDFEPDFNKNSIMIMPSEDEMRSSGGHGNGGNVTQPFVTETYRCMAAYETKDTKNKPFKVATDEKVDVLIKDKAGWWLVENEDKRMAWFPAPYLEKVDDDEEDEDDIDGTSERGMFYTAVKSYNSTKDDEITVVIGAVVEVMQKSDNGWWLIRYKGKVGYIPAMYMQPYSYFPVRLTSQHQDLLNTPSLLSPTRNFQQQSHLSRSQGNLLQIPPIRSSSPISTQVDSIQRSQSLNRLSVEPHGRPAGNNPASVTNNATTTTPAMQAPPTIMVEMNENEKQRRRSPTADIEESSGSDSFSDDFSSSSVGSSLNLSYSAGDEWLRLSHTFPSTVVNRLSPTSNMEGKLHSSVSDPNIFKGPVLPKVPPRPQAEEILTRCSTVTRKNAAKGRLAPPQIEIISP